MAMKKLSASFVTTLLLAAASLPVLAQEPSSSFGLTPGKPDTILPAGSGELPLMPDGASSILDKSPLGGAKTAKTPKQSLTDAAEDALKERLKVRVAKTKAEREPDLQAIWDQGLAAKTDYEQRELWTSYYRKFCDRIGKFDKTIPKATLDTMYAGYVARFNQSRIAPTQKPIAKAGR